MTDRTQLQHMLSVLEEQIPELQRSHPDPADLWPELATRLDDVRAAGGPDHDQWLWESIDSMLRHYGLAVPSLPA